MSILRAEIRRIGSNYARLIAGFLIGIITVRVLIGYGEDVFNIYTLITVGAGVGIMLKELMRIALVRHLSQAWWGNGTELQPNARFSDVYAASFRTSALAVALGLVLMGGVGLFFHHLDVSRANLGSAYIFLGGRAAIMAMAVGLSPLTGMMAVKMQFNRWNGLQTFERIADLISVCVPLLLGTTSQSSALIIFGVTSVLLYGSLYICVARIQIREDKSLIPRVRDTGRLVPARAILWSMGWSAALVLSFNLYLRFDAFFINVQFGAAETVAFGICVQLVGMVRQVTGGLILGLDAVAAKVHFDGKETQATVEGNPHQFAAAELVHYASYVQTATTFSAFIFLWFYGIDLVTLWLTGQAVAPSVIELAGRLSAIMLLGIVFMSISDPWMNALNGVGDLSSYVRFTFPISLMNPVLLIGAATAFGSSLTVEWVGVVFSSLLTISHLIIVPAVFARQSGQSLGKVMAPVMRGAVAPLLILVAYQVVPSGNLPLEGILIGIATAAVLLGGDLIVYASHHRPALGT